jgi:ATP-dependent Clp protease protease subunit
MNTKHVFSPEIKSHEHALKSFDAPKTVIVNGLFNEEMAKTFAQDVNEALQTGQLIVPVVIDSFGGSVYSLLSMLDTIASCPGPVATIIKGKAMSCGAVLAASGTKGYRFVGPLATVMVHEVSSGDYGKIVEVKNSVKEAEALNDLIFTLLDQFGDQVPGYFKALVHGAGHADLFFRAADVVKHGLADQIALPNWQIEMSLSRRLVWSP